MPAGANLRETGFDDSYPEVPVIALIDRPMVNDHGVAIPSQLAQNRKR